MQEVSAVVTLGVLAVGFLTVTGGTIVALKAFERGMTRLIVMGSLFFSIVLESGVIYSWFSQVMFNLPFGDSLPISALFGGSLGGDFNKLSFGVIYGVLMSIVWLLGTVVVILKNRSNDE